MKKQKIQLIILAVLLVAAALSFYIIKSRNDAARAAQPIIGKYTAFSMSSGDFKTISIDNHMNDDPSVPEVLMERDGKNWKFVNSDAEVDTMRANQLLSLIINIPSDYELTDVDKDAYGLDDPIRVVITEKNGTEHVLLFGDKNDYVGEYYMRNEDTGKVYLVGEKLFSQVCVTEKSMTKQAE
ncbi:MAG: DUF4340 domain-containing protein [Lachnospiraceae bacterium]|nr:DUF4340 domain-containing protein [Lachnospiraceae bacterium]